MLLIKKSCVQKKKVEKQSRTSYITRGTVERKSPISDQVLDPVLGTWVKYMPKHCSQQQLGGKGAAAAAASARVERDIFFGSQAGYPHGSLMCTTACMHFGMAVICKKLLLGSDEDHVLNQKLNYIMGVSSNTHGRLEQLHQVYGQ